MSLEQSIADLQSQAGRLLDLPQEIRDAAVDKIHEMSAAYNGLLNNFSATFHVDQENGIDTNAGTEALPFKTIGKALSLVPPGGVCTVKLLNDYHMDETSSFIVDDGRLLTIHGDGVKRNITFQSDTETFGNTEHRIVHGIKTRGRSVAITFYNVHIFMPERAGVAGLPERPESALIHPVNPSYPPHQLHIQFNACELTVHTNRNGPLLADAGFINLMNSGLTVTGTLAGNWLGDVAAGTDPATLWNLRTNLTSL